MFKHLSKLASANQARVALQSTNRVALQSFYNSQKTFGQQLMVKFLLDTYYNHIEEWWDE
jgi:hypothetical protein